MGRRTISFTFKAEKGKMIILEIEKFRKEIK